MGSGSTINSKTTPATGRSRFRTNLVRTGQVSENDIPAVPVLGTRADKFLRHLPEWRQSHHLGHAA